jgi:integrase
MARTGKLSAVEVTKAKGPAVLHDGGGLYLRVAAPGRDKTQPCAKSWVFRFQLNGKRRDMGLGSYPDVSLAAARDKATVGRRHRQDGADPLALQDARRQAERVAIAKGRTFREAAEQFIESNKSGWRNAKHRQQWENTLATYVYGELGDLPVSAIDTGDVVRVLEPIWTTKPETASRVRGRIEAVLDAAKVRGFRDGPNPAQWRGNLALLLPPRAKVRKVVHHPALPFDELAAFLVALRGRKGMSALALEFTIFTAARTEETLGATWGEIDLVAKVWTVPAERMKAEEGHRVPLPGAALAVLARVRPLALQKNGEADPTAPIFPSSRRARPLSNMAMLSLLQQRMKRADITVHGFRSTFRDWAAERTAFPSQVVEMALAHAIENKVEAAYRRGDLFNKRRKLMDAWAGFCNSPASGKVTSIRGTAL